MEWLDTTFFGNTVRQWLIAAGVLVLIYIGLGLIKKILINRISKWAERTQTDLDNLIVDLLRRVSKLLLFAVSLYGATLILTLPPKLQSALRIFVILAFLLQAAGWGNGLILYYIQRYKREKLDTDPASVTTVSALGFVGKLVLWTIILLLALDNLGIDITGLIAGLGIGGIAIALAVQNILGDLFASLSIVLDKPFVIGDFIIVDNFLGSVEHIGLKTTRIKSLSGEQLVFSNSDLLNSRIRNFKRMYERRVVFSLGVIYQTSLEKLQMIPEIIRNIIEQQEKTRFDRAHFKEYGNFSLNFEAVYYVLDPNFNVYMDIHQAINLEIFKQFKQEHIEFAYPTQTLFLEKETNQEAAPSAAN